MVSMVHCQLWMGSLEPFMTETFIINAFKQMGENARSVKVMRNKITGEAAGYCFVHFDNDEEAIAAMHKLNGKPIPGTNPPVRFRLNSASNTGRTVLDRDLSVWVGDLSPDVDDYSLYRVFSSKFNTIKTAKVILDASGFSKGYGFVHFGSEDEMKNCLTAMNGYVGLGSKALKICNAVSKAKPTTATSTPSTPTASITAASAISSNSTTDYSQYYDTTAAYWQNYAQWAPQQSYYEQGENSSVVEAGQPIAPHPPKDDTALELIEHTIPLDVETINRERVEQDCVLWDALESSKWFPPDALEIY